MLTPYISDNHIRPQVDYVMPGHRLFDLSDGLDQVVRWINQVAGVVETGAPVPHEKRSAPQPLSVSKKSGKAVEKFYRADYELLAALREPSLVVN